MKPSKPKDIDDYIAGFPAEVQKVLMSVRATVKSVAPGAKETIKYGMPTFTMDGNLVYFAAFKKHIGFYPVPVGAEAFKEFSSYKTGRGSIQFPLDKPMPLKLIAKIVRYNIRRLRERKITK